MQALEEKLQYHFKNPALLGISKPVVKAHGSASEVGICNAVRQATEVARSGIIDDIAQNIDKIRIEQKAE